MSHMAFGGSGGAGHFPTCLKADTGHTPRGTAYWFLNFHFPVSGVFRLHTGKFSELKSFP